MTKKEGVLDSRREKQKETERIREKERVSKKKRGKRVREKERGERTREKERGFVRNRERVKRKIEGREGKGKKG